MAWNLGGAGRGGAGRGGGRGGAGCARPCKSPPPGGLASSRRIIFQCVGAGALAEEPVQAEL